MTSDDNSSKHSSNGRSEGGGGSVGSGDTTRDNSADAAGGGVHTAGGDSSAEKFDAQSSGNSRRKMISKPANGRQSKRGVRCGTRMGAWLLGKVSRGGIPRNGMPRLVGEAAGTTGAASSGVGAFRVVGTVRAKGSGRAAMGSSFSTGRNFSSLTLGRTLTMLKASRVAHARSDRRGTHPASRTHRSGRFYSYPCRGCSADWRADMETLGKDQ